MLRNFLLLLSLFVLLAQLLYAQPADNGSSSRSISNSLEEDVEMMDINLDERPAGHCIPPEILSNIFEYLFQLPDTSHLRIVYHEAFRICQRNVLQSVQYKEFVERLAEFRQLHSLEEGYSKEFTIPDLPGTIFWPPSGVMDNTNLLAGVWVDSSF